MNARVLRLVRTEPGPSEATARTGVVAEACVFSSGTAVLQWLTRPPSTEVYASEKDMRKIREFSGRAHFEETSRIGGLSDDDVLDELGDRGIYARVQLTDTQEPGQET